MQNLNLGDYKGGRDTLGAAIQQPFDTPAGIRAVLPLAGQGLATAAADHARTLQDKMNIKNRPYEEKKLAIAQEYAKELDKQKSDAEYKKTMDFAEVSKKAAQEAAETKAYNDEVHAKNLAYLEEQKQKALKAEDARILKEQTDAKTQLAGEIARKRLKAIKDGANAFNSQLPDSATKTKNQALFDTIYHDGTGMTDEEAIAHVAHLEKSGLMDFTKVASLLEASLTSKLNAPTPPPPPPPGGGITIGADGLPNNFHDSSQDSNNEANQNNNAALAPSL